MPHSYVKIFVITLLAATLTTAAVGTWWLYHDANNLKFFNTEKTTGPIAIQICMAKGSGGMERCALAQHKALLDAGINSIIICRENTFISDTAKSLGIPCITCCPNRISLGRVVFMPGVEAALRWVIGTHQVLAIHCHYKREIFAAKKVTESDRHSFFLSSRPRIGVRGDKAQTRDPLKKFIPVVLTQHTPSALAKSVRTTADGIVAVSLEMKAALERQNERDSLMQASLAQDPGSTFQKTCRHAIITVIPPFFDDAKFATIPPITDRNAFFKTQFNITLKPCPLLVKIAHLYSNEQPKNHPLLFKAMRELIINRHTPVQVALAGKGPMLDTYKKMVRELGIADYVHFLGSTELTPQVLQCADINLLASKEEAFGIVLLEGGLMRKPTIVARGGCGAADWLIIDKETGFLFENNDEKSLADTIAYALAHEDEAKACGQRLYEKVVAEFMPHQTATRLLELYHRLANAAAL